MQKPYQEVRDSKADRGSLVLDTFFSASLRITLELTEPDLTDFKSRLTFSHIKIYRTICHSERISTSILTQGKTKFFISFKFLR